MTLAERNIITERMRKIIGAKNIKLGSISPDIDYESFNWDVQGNNLLDKWCEEFNKNLTSDDECWRFFEWHGNGEHLVVTGRGIESQEEDVNE